MKVFQRIAWLGQKFQNFSAVFGGVKNIVDEWITEITFSTCQC